MAKKIELGGFFGFAVQLERAEIGFLRDVSNGVSGAGLVGRLDQKGVPNFPLSWLLLHLGEKIQVGRNLIEVPSKEEVLQSLKALKDEAVSRLRRIGVSEEQWFLRVRLLALNRLISCLEGWPTPAPILPERISAPAPVQI